MMARKAREMHPARVRKLAMIIGFALSASIACASCHRGANVIRPRADQTEAVLETKVLRNRWQPLLSAGIAAWEQGEKQDAWFVLSRARSVVDREGGMVSMEPPSLSFGGDETQAFAVHGDQLLILDDFGSLRIWNMRTNRMIQRIWLEEDGDLPELVVSRDGRWAARVGTNITMIELGSGAVEVLYQGEYSADAFAFCHDRGSFMAVVDGEIVEWDIVRSTERRRQRLRLEDIGFGTFSTDCTTLAMTLNEDTEGVDTFFVGFWSVDTGQEERRIAVPPSYDVLWEAPELSPDGRLVALRVRSDLIVWNISSGQALNRPLEHDLSIEDVTFSPDRRLLASVTTGSEGTEGSIWLWDVASGRRLLKVDVVVDRVAFTQDSRRLVASVSGTPGVIDIDVEDGRLRGRLGDGSVSITALGGAPDGSAFAVGTAGDRVHLWKIGEPLRHSTVALSAVALVFTGRGERLIVTGEQGTHLVEVERGVAQRQLAATRGKALSVSADGQLVALVEDAEEADESLLDRDRLRIFTTDTGDERWSVDALTVSGGALFLADDRLVHGSTVRGRRGSRQTAAKLVMRELSTGAEVRSRELDAPLAALTATSDGRTIAALWGTTVHLVDAATLTTIRRFEGPSGYPPRVGTLIVSEDGTRLIASATMTGWSLLVWDVNDGRAIIPQDNNRQWASGVAHVSPDVVVSSGSRDLTVIGLEGARTLATVAPTFNGGWLAWTPSGGVDGPETDRHLMTTVVQSEAGDEHRLSWHLGWGRHHLRDLVGRALRSGVEPRCRD